MRSPFGTRKLIWRVLVMLLVLSTSGCSWSGEDEIVNASCRKEISSEAYRNAVELERQNNLGSAAALFSAL